jgi:hypothetical protein
MAVWLGLPDCFLRKSLGWTWVGVPVFFNRFVLVVDLVSRVSLLRRCRLGGAVAGHLFVTCRQHVAPCFHMSSSSRVGWEDGSCPPLVPQVVGTSRYLRCFGSHLSSSSSVAGL